MRRKFAVRIFLCGVLVCTFANVASAETPVAQEGDGSETMQSPSATTPAAETMQGPSATTPAAASPEDEEESPLTSRDNRSSSTVGLNYTLFSRSLLMTKRGPSLSYVHDEDWTFEVEYLTGDFGLSFHSLNFASFSEELLLGRARWFPGTNSFHFLFGLGRRHYKLELGGEYLDRLARADISRYGRLEVENEVVELGMGNRWEMDRGFTIGVDWLSLFIPVTRGTTKAPALSYITDERNRDRAGDVLSTLKYLPSFLAFKFQLGWTF